MRVYIAGPMTGFKDWNHPAFFRAAENLARAGYEPLNPADEDLTFANEHKDEPDLVHAHYMRKDIDLLLQADAIALLPGWQSSKGARFEHDVARMLGLGIYDEHMRELSETVLEEAQRLVYGDRQAAYGHPADDYDRTARLWSIILGHDVTARQAALCMVMVKVSRECNAHKRDNLVDMAGYAAVVDRIARREAGLE